jgi:hypothetical protein
MLRLPQAELERSLDEERSRLGRVDVRLRQIESEGREYEYAIVLKTIAPQRVLSLGGPVAGYGCTRALLDRLQQTLRQAQMLEVQSATLLAAYTQHADDSILEAEVGIPAGATARALRTSLPGLALHNWPAAPQAAATLHQGDAEGIS